MSMLEIRQERDTPAGVEVVAPRGEIDISNVEIMDQVLGEVVEQQPRCLVVDLSGVTYMDSAAISSLLRAGQKAAQKQARLVLVGGSPFTRRLIRMTGIDRLYAHVETLAAALGGEPEMSPNHRPAVCSVPGPALPSHR